MRPFKFTIPHLNNTLFMFVQSESCFVSCTAGSLRAPPDGLTAQRVPQAPDVLDWKSPYVRKERGCVSRVSVSSPHTANSPAHCQLPATTGWHTGVSAIVATFAATDVPASGVLASRLFEPLITCIIQ